MTPRKSATEKKESASLPEVPIPLSEVPEHQRGAYQVALIEDPAAMRSALSQEDFFPMLANFPEAWWERLSLYLYRRPDDEGRMVKNDGPRKYQPGGVLRQPVDEEFISKKWGGGKYTLYLKLDSKETLREHTFAIDGPPKVLPGQYVEQDGKPIPIGVAAPTATPESNAGDNIAKVIEANARASESQQEMLVTAAEKSMEIVTARATAETASTSNIIQLLLARVLQPPAVVAPPVAAPDPLRDKLLEVVIERAFGEKQNPEPKDTPIEEAISSVEKITGRSLPDLLKPAARAAVENEYGWVAPLANLGMNILQQLPHIMRQASEARQAEFDRQIYLRNLASTNPGQPAVQPRLPPAAPLPTGQTGPQVVPNNPPAPSAQLDAGKLLENIITMICTQFDKHMFAGADVAAALAVQYGDQIEAFGLAKTLGNPAEMKVFIDGIPALKQRSTDARWAEFQDDFLQYTEDLWGAPTGEVEKPPAA